MLGDAFGHAKNISRVLVVIFHQRFILQRAPLLRVAEPLRNLILHAEMERVRGAGRRVVKVGAEAQEKIVGHLDPPPVRFAQPILANQVRGGERAFLEESHPKKILIIAQASAAALEMRFLDVNAIAKFCMARRLILHAQLDVFPLVAAHAIFPEGLAKTPGQFRVARDLPRFQHRGFRQHVGIRQLDGFGDRTRGVSHFEADVPEQIKNLLDYLGGVGGNVRSLFVVEKHDVHVAEGIELAASITAERDHGERGGGDAFGLIGKRDRGIEDVMQEHVDQLDAKRANLPSTPSVLVAEPQTMLLDFQELLVKRQRFRRPHGADRGEFTLRVRQNFSEMTRGGHSLRIWNVEALVPSA